MPDFSTLLASLTPAGDAYEAVVGDDWLQGRTTYGGLSAALCVEAAQRAFEGLPPLRSAQFVFAGPVAGAVRMTPAVLRRGKSTTIAAVDLGGEGGIGTRATLVFAASRESMHAYAARTMPQVAPPAACPDFFHAGAPSFVRYFEARLAAGSAPMSGSADPDFVVWVRHRDPAARAAVTALVALGDIPPPPAMALFRAFAPLSTMTWSIDLPTAPPLAADDDGWRLMRSTAETILDGYCTQSMTVWSQAGDVLLVGRQNVAIFS